MLSMTDAETAINLLDRAEEELLVMWRESGVSAESRTVKLSSFRYAVLVARAHGLDWKSSIDKARDAAVGSHDRNRKSEAAQEVIQ